MESGTRRSRARARLSLQVKTLIIALFLYYLAGFPDHAIYVYRLEDCERMGPEITEELRRMEGGHPQFMCLFAEEPPPEYEHEGGGH